MGVEGGTSVAMFEPNLMSRRGGRWIGTMRDGELALWHALARIVIEGVSGVGSYVIVEVDGAFVQFAGTRGDTELWCETVSNHYLPVEQRLGEVQIARLHELGFSSPTRAPWDEPKKGRCPNYHRRVDVGKEARLFEAGLMVFEILREAYDCAPGAEMRIELRMAVWPATGDEHAVA